MRRRAVYVALLVLLPLVLIACPSTQVKPEGMLYKAESLYISQRADYDSNFDYDPVTQKYTLKASVTEEQANVLREREKVLKDFKLAIDAYRAYIKAGQTPSVEAEQQLISFIRRFTGG